MSELSMGHSANSPPSAMDDGNIREGLGSLNRWSQSTTSSSVSPYFVSHQRQESAHRMPDSGNYTFHKRVPSLESNARARSPNKSGDGRDNPDLYVRQHVSQLSAGLAYTEGTISEEIDPSLSQAEASSLEPVPIQHDSRTHRLSPQRVDYAPVIHSNHTLTRPSSQNDKRRQGPSQKTMLSKALQKANTAVLLDNAANFEGAMEAYSDACQLLQLVMIRSNGGEDEKLKLQEIRDTYMIRVTELQRMDLPFRNVDGKALPERPHSQESYGEYINTIPEEEYTFRSEEPGPLGPEPIGAREPLLERSRASIQPRIPPRRQSLLPSAIDGGVQNSPSYASQNQADSCSVAQNRPFTHRLESSGLNTVLMEGQTFEEDSHTFQSRLSELSILSAQVQDPNESTSWLDTIDESGASSSPSERSKASSVYLRRRTSSRLSHGTEAEFDAALDAAVEAAYDEGFEPASESEAQEDSDDIFANARRNVELAKQKVREAEREAEVAMTRGRGLRQDKDLQTSDNKKDLGLDYLDEEAEEEERLLEEMTRGYVMDDFEFDSQSKSALPRQSTSSSGSRSIWESPAAHSTTAGSVLPPLVEDDTLPFDQKPIQQPETGPSFVSARPVSRSMPGQGVRARRMSGQNTAELKIETRTHSRSGSTNPDLSQLSDAQMARPPTREETDEPRANPPQVNEAFGTASSVLSSAVHQVKRNVSVGSLNENTLPNLNLAREITAVEDEDDTHAASNMLSPSRPAIGKVPSAPDNLGRPHPGSLPFRSRNVSVPNPDIYSDSPVTPSMNTFPTLDFQKGIATASINALATPTVANFTPSGLPSDGLYLFDNYIHSPTSPGSPNPLAPNSPLPLEPCPESFLLRPFWLLRCIYQTIAHPRGGYISTKLFIPRDVWRVKNVKIRGIEEKVSNCDLLTAALLKLSKVDTYDADAVLEEMQTFESVLDQVQTSLSKKVGNEVGVQGAMPLFKAAQALDDTAAIESLPTRASNAPGKSYLSSWRKLRPKNSGFGAGPLPSSKEAASKDHLTLSSLPMTPIPNAQHADRNIAQVQFNGPNANYMSALARLCDAAQVLDQIAQQVEDPGLKHSSQTLVGLELSTRHAAEFFGFYICRFALNDIGIMLDKFIKRGSEWVLL